MIRVVLVGIEGAYNLGVISRTCVNFKVNELYLVNPSASVEEALLYSAKGREFLEKAVVVSSLDEALKGVDASVATSAKGYSPGDVLRQAIDIETFTSQIAPRIGRMALVFGRESTGLTREELAKTDFIVSIPGNPEYPVLNVSQAVAIFLWELWKIRREQSLNIAPSAPREEVEALISLVDNISSAIISTPEKARRAGLVWRRILHRARPTAYEARVLKYWLYRVRSKLGGG
ncbi:RNA methyltransferase [Thermosphaera chiliense]|uniref:RNA methyltransferase n=1 Tax=Thermosphaera chiliense TaxID=3402707 RepID=A0A7M1USC7_9CREN|nr:TrmH family RNA methyltransferase [Thermosphaera aggregans]QOR94427.1 RNA methyltransferase [Thermosphaera aggregans]